MNKKVTAAILSSLIVINGVSNGTVVYAVENTNEDNIIQNQDTKLKKIVHLENGEGDLDAGDGSADNPYKNIRTALNNIEEGGVLKIVGLVQYTKYIPHTDKSPLPLFINKKITIEGTDDSDVFSLRAPIQLGADVTFRNMTLYITPQRIFGRNLENNSKLLGTEIERASTIFAAGHTLTLDDVNTKFGTNPEEYNKRIYISGGAYKDQEIKGKKSIINVINPNEETKIAGIYAGDYYTDRKLDVEINLDAKLVGTTTIHTGGVNNILDGDVVVNLGTESNVKRFDKSNHIGELNVNLKKSFFSHGFNAARIDNLSMEEGSKVILEEGSSFSVNNLTLASKAVIDFRNGIGNPIVRGNFISAENVSDASMYAAIILGNDQTLEVNGELTGATRLNVNRPDYVLPYKDKHEYVRANGDAKGNFTIEGSAYDSFELNRTFDNNKTVWSVTRLSSAVKEFYWVGGDDRIINPAFGEEYTFPIEFIDDEDNRYKPDPLELLYDYEYTIEKPNRDIVHSGDFDDHVDFGLNSEKSESEDPDILNEISLYLSNEDELVGEMILTVKNTKTLQSISKTIYLVRDTDVLNEDVNIIGNVVEGKTISVDTSKLPSECKELTYTWYIDGIEVSSGKSSEFTLTKDHVGRSIKVEVEAINYYNSVFSKEYTVKPKGLAPTIEGIKDIEIKASQVEEFNKTTKYDGITVKDDIDNNLQVSIIGEVKKPKAGTSETYELIYYVEDTYGNRTEEIRRVTVTNEVPKFSGLSEITITKGDEYDIEYGVTAYDKEDEDITKDIVYPKVDLSKFDIGSYEIEYSVTDIDGELKVLVTGIVEKPKAGETKTYVLTYYVVDSDNNRAEAVRRVTVSNEVPEILGLSKITINEGESYDIKDGVTAYDKEDGYITKDIVYPTVDLSKLSAGTYEIEYIVKDSDDNITKVKRLVEILKIQGDDSDNNQGGSDDNVGSGGDNDSSDDNVGSEGDNDGSGDKADKTENIEQPITNDVTDTTITNSTNSNDISNTDDLDNVDDETSNEVEETIEDTENEEDIEENITTNKEGNENSSKNESNNNETAKNKAISTAVKVGIGATAVGGIAVGGMAIASATASTTASATGGSSLGQILRRIFRRRF